MSESDTEQPGDASVVPPAVLLIHCNNAQQYLDPDNQVLAALYGHAPAREQVYNIPNELLAPLERFNRIEVMELFPDVSLNQLPDLVMSDQFLDVIWGDICHRMGRGPAADMADIRVVIIPHWVVEDEKCRVLPALRRHLPHATIFQIREHGRPSVVSP